MYDAVGVADPILRSEGQPEQVAGRLVLHHRFEQQRAHAALEHNLGRGEPGHEVLKVSGKDAIVHHAQRLEPPLALPLLPGSADVNVGVGRLRSGHCRATAYKRLGAKPPLSAARRPDLVLPVPPVKGHALDIGPLDTVDLLLFDEALQGHLEVLGSSLGGLQRCVESLPDLAGKTRAKGRGTMAPWARQARKSCSLLQSVSPGEAMGPDPVMPTSLHRPSPTEPQDILVSRCGGHGTKGTENNDGTNCACSLASAGQSPRTCMDAV